MILTRFLSKAEYNAYMRGKTLYNSVNYRNKGYRSTSRGFCFTTDEPRTAWRYLKGLVSSEMCIVVDIDDKLLTPSKAQYAGYPDDGGVISTIKTEYCLTRYNNRTARLIRALHTEDFATEDELNALALLSVMGLVTM